MNIQEQLESRMRSYDGFFSGYPTNDEHDIYLIIESAAQANESVMVHLAYVASTIDDIRGEYQNALNYIRAYVDNMIDCNMSEGNNPFYAEANA